MATCFLTYFPDGQYVLTSAIGSVKVSTTKPRVDVKIACSDGGAGSAETFFSTSLYSFGGIVEVDDVGPLIEQYFRGHDMVTGTVAITVDGVTATVRCLYCEYDMPDGFDPQNALFLASTVQRVQPDSTVAMASLFRDTAPSFYIKAVGHSAADGALAVSTYVVQRDPATVTAYFNVGSIIRTVTSVPDENHDVRLADVLYFSIEYGPLQKMCYIVRAAPGLTFSFRNIFNVEEFLTVAGVVSAKTDVKRELADCNGRTESYDRRVERTFTVNSEPLTVDEVHVYEQLLASHDVKLWVDGDEYDVLVTDHTCEPSSADEELSTVKFTWRFASRRPRLFDSPIDGILPSGRGIFNDTFTPEYE